VGVLAFAQIELETRDAAVTASAALALQLESRGRAVCGIGRGEWVLKV